jgi:hypothetical protein
MEIEQIYRYIDPYSLLVMTPEKLIRVNVPFQVELIFSIQPLSADNTLMVTKIMLSQDKKLVYIIKGAGYSYGLFRIVV